MQPTNPPYLHIQSDPPNAIRHLKEYSPLAKYAQSNVQGICTNIMNLTINTEIVVSFADFLNAGLVNVTLDPECKTLSVKSQKHEGFEIYFVMNGQLNVKIEKTDYQLKHYDALVMNQNCKSQILGGTNLIVITITLSKDYLKKNKLLKSLDILSYKSRYEDNYRDAEYVILHSRETYEATKKQTAEMLSAECKEDIEKLLYQFHTEMQKKVIGYKQIVSGLLLRLFFSLNNPQIYKAEHITEKIWTGDEIAEQIKLYLDEHPKKVTMYELTNRFHYNRNYIAKAFSQTMDQTIKDYNNMVCMKEARKLLSETSLPIELIAEKLGFLSRAQFYKVFQKEFRCTPAEMRKQKSSEKHEII